MARTSSTLPERETMPYSNAFYPQFQPMQIQPKSNLDLIKQMVFELEEQQELIDNINKAISIQARNIEVLKRNDEMFKQDIASIKSNITQLKHDTIPKKPVASKKKQVFEFVLNEMMNKYAPLDEKYIGDKRYFQNYVERIKKVSEKISKWKLDKIKSVANYNGNLFGDECLTHMFCDSYVKYYYPATK